MDEASPRQRSIHASTRPQRRQIDSVPVLDRRASIVSIVTYIIIIYHGLLGLAVIYICSSIYLTLQHELKVKTQEHSAAMLAEIAKCAKHYNLNQCDASTRVPGLESACEYWETCMNRDPMMVPKVKLYAEIINSFVETLSYKSMFFFIAIIIPSIVFICMLRAPRFLDLHAHK